MMRSIIPKSSAHKTSCFLSLISVRLFLRLCVSQQAGQLFCVGLPSSYSLPTLEPPLPRLPSYESVRKKDRQRKIHMMIADRFGLNGPIVTEVKAKLGIRTVSQQLIQSQNALTMSCFRCCCYAWE